MTEIETFCAIAFVGVSGRSWEAHGVGWEHCQASAVDKCLPGRTGERGGSPHSVVLKADYVTTAYHRFAFECVLFAYVLAHCLLCTYCIVCTLCICVVDVSGIMIDMQNEMRGVYSNPVMSIQGYWDSIVAAPQNKA